MTTESPSEPQEPGAAPEPPNGEQSPATSSQATHDSAASTPKDDEAPEGKGQAGPKTPPKPVKPPIESVEDLLREAFESKAHVLSFATDKLKKLSIDQERLTSQAATVATLAKSDPTLSGPFKLLQYVASRGVQLDRGSGAPLEAALERLRDLALLALGLHPVFRVWNEELLDPRRTPELSVSIIRDQVRNITPDHLGLAAEEFKEADRNRLLKHAIACLSLVRTLQREWSLDRFINESRAAVWSAEAPKAIGPEKAAGLLSATRDAALLGLLAETYEARVNVRDREIEKLKNEAARAANRETRLTGDLAEASKREETLAARAEAFSADIVRLQKELAAERDNRVVDKSHMADDYETLRTRVIRRLSGEIDLLTDALHALRNGASPVAEEFLDRSLLALSREVEQLKDSAGGLA